jgi:hypothetical protein
MDPTDHNGNPIKYKQSKMRFKRFKTLLLEYLNYDSRLASTLIKHVLYVDIDNVVGKDLTPFFQQYFSTITPWRKDNGLVRAANDSATIVRSTIVDAAAASSRNLTASSVTPVTTTTTEAFSFLSQFKDKGMPGFWHTGIMMMDRQHSGGCLQQWRKMIDQFGGKTPSDQGLLLSILKNITTYHCWVHELHKDHFILPNNPFFQQKRFKTFVHVTGTRAKRMNKTIQEDYFRDVLKLNKRGDEILFGNVTWEESIRVRLWGRI